MISIGVVMSVLAACAGQRTPPAEATISEAPPPWAAPRDAISWIELAGLEPERLDTTTNQRIIELRVIVDGQPVEVPAYIGVDRVRALQASAHTHDATGKVWLEGGQAREVTVGQFFTLWGVRLDEDCLGATCGGTRITAERGGSVSDADTALALGDAEVITVEVG